MSDFQGILLDEADGVNRTQEPVMPAGFQPPKIVVSSWNRKVTLAFFFFPTQDLDDFFFFLVTLKSAVCFCDIHCFYFLIRVQALVAVLRCSVCFMPRMLRDRS